MNGKPAKKSGLRERVNLLGAPGGKRAMAYWLLRRLGRLDVYQLYSVALHGASEIENSEAFELIVLRDRGDSDQHDPGLIDTINAKSGCGVAETIRRGGRIYVLARRGELLSQLKIEFGGGDVDTPADLHVSVGRDGAFLSFLYTPAGARRRGWAKLLVAMTCAALTAEGLKYCVCHVQATNVRSSHTFESLGWEAAGWLIATTGGKFLRFMRKPLGRRVGLKVQANPHGASARPATPG